MPLAAEYRAMFDQLACARVLPLEYATYPLPMRERCIAPPVHSIPIFLSIRSRTPQFPARRRHRLTCYRPRGPGPFGVLVYFHSGGWVIGDLDTADSSVSTVGDEADLVIVSVDYRLAPEHLYPAAVEDSFAALQWVHTTTGLTAARLAFVGKVLATA